MLKLAWLKVRADLLTADQQAFVARMGHFLRWSESQRAEIDALIEANMAAIYGDGVRLPKGGRAMTFAEWRVQSRAA
ncbi:MAG TPA: hypothetical protein VMX97_08970 [Hyphomicrobiaceae bacterium]|nr:hypothetical protein [Hyphomicrobiaceae bacterium]